MITANHRNMIIGLFVFFAAVLYPKFALSATSNVELEWEAVPNAKAYDLEVKSTKNTFKFQVNQPVWAGRLSPGFFKMRVRGRDKRGVPGEWSPYQEFKVFLDTPEITMPVSNTVISSNSDSLQKVKFKWNKVFGAKKYILTLNGVGSDFTKQVELTEDQVTLELPVATKFIASVRAENEVLTSNPESDVTSSFIINGPKVGLVQITQPDSLFIREVKWNKPEFAKRYSYMLERQEAQSQKFTLVDEAKEIGVEEVPFKKEYPGGVYRITVRASADYRATSNPSILRFVVKDGDRSEQAEALARMRESIDRLSGWFVTASSLVNSVKYENRNYDLTGTQTSYEAIGATFRLGLGYATIKKPWGYFVAMESSQLKIDGFGDIKYNTLEVNSYFKMKPNDFGEFRQTAGVIIKELPDLTRNLAGTVKNTSPIKALGVRYGVEYWHALTSKLGTQVNAQASPLLFKLKTTNGEAIVPTLSYQAGFLLSYRWSKNLTTLGGYAYRSDSIEYKTKPSAAFTEPSGDKNSATLKGHYLNLFLEYQL